MKKLKNNLDEMQELNLLRIEKRGFWIGYLGLLAAIIVQTLLYQENNLKYTAGELIVFFICSFYVLADCLRKGIWGRRTEPSAISNLFYTVACSGIFSVIMGVIKYIQYGSFAGAVASGIVFFVMIAVLCYIVLTVMMIFYRKRVAKLDEEPEE